MTTTGMENGRASEIDGERAGSSIFLAWKVGGKEEESVAGAGKRMCVGENDSGVVKTSTKQGTA